MTFDPPNVAAAPPASKPPKRQTIKDDEALLPIGVAAMGHLFHPPKLATDTVKFLIRQKLDRTRKTSIEAALYDTGCGPVYWDKTAARKYWHRLEIQDPNDDTYRCLASLLPGNRLSGRDIAVDFLADTGSRYFAEILAHNLNHTVTQRWRGKRKTGRCQDTFYGAPRKTRPTPTSRKTSRNWRCYLSKTGEPIVRFEAIYSGADLCKGRGLWTAADLIGLDLANWLMRDFRFSMISWKKFDNLIRRDARKTVRACRDRPRPTVAAEEEKLKTEIFTAFKQPLLPGETLAHLPVQDLLDAHPLLREAAVHTSFFDLSA